ncbi:hypothetical protein [Thalassotalea insulae]|nr:hypothetical protein [Thalassotalea insulae]
MTFKIIEKDWYKRRQLTGKELSPVSVSIPDYQAVHNHFCNMFVRYNDGSEKSLLARVIYNKLTAQWTVDGMEVAVKVIEQ